MAFSLILSGPRPPRRLLGSPEVRDLSRQRMPWVFYGMLLWGLLIFTRLVWLQVFRHGAYQHRASQQHELKLDLPAIRGELRDRRGIGLAASIRAESLFCTPRAFYPNYAAGDKDKERQWGEPDRQMARDVATRLAKCLDTPKARLEEMLLRKKPFVWIERQLPPQKVDVVKAAKLNGLGFLAESRRDYPRKSLACQIIGFTDVDGTGRLGIEHAFNEQLAGKPGQMVALRDARGRMLGAEDGVSQPPVNGCTLQLTLDASIQHIVEQTLQESVQQYKPLTAYAVVVDPNTGEILAMAGTPVFDPNEVLPRKLRNRSESEFSPTEKEELKRELDRQRAARKVHPVEDAYEPGSTMKIFTAAIALEERKIHLGEQIDCMNGRWPYSSKLTITDTHPNGMKTFEEVLWVSSNIGTAKIGLRLDPTVHYAYLRKFGFGEPTGLNFPGETSGRLITPDKWSGTTQPTFCYGYGLSTSPLQILMAGCALANGGKLMRPFLVHKFFNDQGILLQETQPIVRGQVISEETSQLMREALKGVITHGTAKKALLDGGIEAFGKTGTSRKLVDGKYDPKRHYASFMGFFPADKPQYGVLVMLDEPQGELTGGDVAAPMFKKIGDGILRYRAVNTFQESEANFKLSLRNWPASENDEAMIHIEQGKVPDVRGLPLKSAICRIVLAGGRPQITNGNIASDKVLKIQTQSPEPGTPLEPGAIVRLKGETP